VKEYPPVTPPYGTALYSDQGYFLLSRVLERITNSTYDEAIESILGEPLGLNITTVMPKGDDVNGIIFPGTPGIDTAWGYDNVLIAG
jgi:CubicO group peptidase (beta-lactamase class C family)